MIRRQPMRLMGGVQMNGQELVVPHYPGRSCLTERERP